MQEKEDVICALQHMKDGRLWLSEESDNALLPECGKGAERAIEQWIGCPGHSITTIDPNRSLTIEGRLRALALYKR